MAKPQAPVWLRESFRDGVDERYTVDRFDLAAHGGHREPPEPGNAILCSAYDGADIACWLAQHDPLRRPCSGRLERCHMIPRQRVENALGALLPTPRIDVFDPASIWSGMSRADRDDLILLAAWDPRNGVIACELHHRRFDSALTPALVVPRAALPGHVEEFIADYGLESEAERRFS